VGRAGGSAQAAWRRTRAAEWAAWIPSADASTRSPALLVGMVTPLPPVVEANVVTGFRVTVTEPSGTVRPRSTWMVASAVGPIHWVVSVPSAAAGTQRLGAGRGLQGDRGAGQRLGPAGKLHLGEPLPLERLPAGQVTVADEHRGLARAAGLGGGQDEPGVVGRGRSGRTRMPG
jgi:hypothetical protein